MSPVEQIITIDPDEIRGWAEERDAKPMKKRGTGHSGMDPAVLDLAFPRKDDPSLEPFDWDDWFNELDEQRLAAILWGEGAESTIKIMRRDRVVMSAPEKK
jgi:hypothetical protein